MAEESREERKLSRLVTIGARAREYIFDGPRPGRKLDWEKFFDRNDPNFNRIYARIDRGEVATQELFALIRGRLIAKAVVMITVSGSGNSDRLRDAEDIVNELGLSLWEKAQSRDYQSREDKPERTFYNYTRSQFINWAETLLQNAVKDFWKKQNRRKEISLEATLISVLGAEKRQEGTPYQVEAGDIQTGRHLTRAEEIALVYSRVCRYDNWQEQRFQKALQSDTKAVSLTGLSTEERAVLQSHDLNLILLKCINLLPFAERRVFLLRRKGCRVQEIATYLDIECPKALTLLKRAYDSTGAHLAALGINPQKIPRPGAVLAGVKQPRTDGRRMVNAEYGENPQNIVIAGIFAEETLSILSGTQRQVIDLLMGGSKYDEIAPKLGMKKPAVRKCAERAREKIREALGIESPQIECHKSGLRDVSILRGERSKHREKYYDGGISRVKERRWTKPLHMDVVTPKVRQVA